MSGFTVVGAGGFIGGALVAWLRAQGHQVAGVARSDIPAMLTAGRPAGHVIYCAGLTADFRARPLATADAHVGLVARVLERLDCESFLYVSSSRVYARVEIGREDVPVEVQPGAPGDLYNITKLAGEALCLSDPRPGLRVARLSNVYGPRMGRANFLGQILDDGLSTGEIVLRQGLRSAKDYIALEDVLPALHAIATRGAARLYNVASGTNVSHDALAGVLTRQFGWRVTAEPTAAATRFPRLDITRLATEFATPTHRLLDDLPRLVADLHRDVAQPATAAAC